MAPSNDVGAEIAVALEAPFAMAAGAVRVDGDQRAAFKPEFGDVLGEVAAEFVARHEAVADFRGADGAVLVVMEVAAADPDRGDVDQSLARAVLRADCTAPRARPGPRA
jgi:hypothetical protein